MKTKRELEREAAAASRQAAEAAAAAAYQQHSNPHSLVQREGYGMAHQMALVHRHHNGDVSAVMRRGFLLPLVLPGRFET
jgi:hypothetical protein